MTTTSEARRQVLDLLAETDDGLVVDVHSAQSQIAIRLRHLPSTVVATACRELEAEGAIDRRRTRGGQFVTGVRLTEKGWRAVGKNRAQRQWPDGELDRAAPAGRPRDGKGPSIETLHRAADAWQRRPRDHPERRCVAVQIACDCDRKRALYLVDLCREQGLLPALFETVGAS